MTNGDPYLVPASVDLRADVFVDNCDKPRLASSRNKSSVVMDADKDCENVALLLNSRSVVYSNSSDSDEESVRETGILQTIA